MSFGANADDYSNNISANGLNTIYAVTGYGNETDEGKLEDQVIQSKDFDNYISESGSTNNWLSDVGKKCSTTKNETGVYDMNGGLNELVSVFCEEIERSEGDYEIFSGNSSKYITKMGKKENDFYGYSFEDVKTFYVSYTDFTEKRPYLARGRDFGAGTVGLKGNTFHWVSAGSGTGYNTGFRCVLIPKS